MTTYDFPYLVPTASARGALAGGTYRLHRGGPSPSYLLLSLAGPDTLG